MSIRHRARKADACAAVEVGKVRQERANERDCRHLRRHSHLLLLNRFLPDEASQAALRGKVAVPACANGPVTESGPPPSRKERSKWPREMREGCGTVWRRRRPAAALPRHVLDSNDAREGRPVRVLAFIRGEIKLTPIYCLRRQDEDPFLPFTVAWLDSLPLVKAPTHDHGMHGRWSLFSRDLCGIGSWGDGGPGRGPTH